MNLTMFGLGSDSRRSSLTLDPRALERLRSERRSSLAAVGKQRGSSETLDKQHRWRLFDRSSRSMERLDELPPSGAGSKQDGTKTLDRDRDRDRAAARSGKVERRGSLVTRWYRLIKDAADAYQGRDSKGHKRAESAHTLLQAQDSNDSTGAVSSPVAGAAGLSCREEEGEGEREGEERPPPLPPPRNSAPDLTQQGSEEEPQAPPTSPTASRHQNLLSVPTTTGGGDGASGAGAVSPGQRRRMQRVEMMKITECTPLIDPKEVVVSQGVVLSAEPVLTPIERLRRKDEQVRRCLAEKEELVADILQIPRQDFRHIAEMAAEPGMDKDARELILNAILSVDRSMSIINDTLRVGEADIVVSTSTPGPGPGPAARPPGPQLLAVDRLLRVNSRLAATLTSLLGLMTEREEERERMRRELRQSHRRLAQLQLRAAGSSSSCQQQESQPESQQEPRTESQPEPAAELSSAAEQTDTDEESSRTKPDVTSSQDSSTELANETLDTESTHETETFDSASSSSACLTFESAADHT